jgi:hypothetical protein
MSLITQSLPALYNGVSQQPATLRLPSQCEEQINALSTVADGVRKRPPFEHVARVTTSDISSAFIHEINRDTTERYQVVITDGDLKVYDMADGTEETVNFPNGKVYLAVVGSGTADQSFACVSVADYTFIVNKTVAVELEPAGDEATLPTGWADFAVPSGWASTPGALPDFLFTVPARTNRGTVQTFADLPNDDDNPLEGDVYKVAGADVDGFGAYWVRRTGGVWEETTEPGIQNRLDANSMPWALVREADGEFYFRQFKWQPRQVGDEVSNPPPTFVGRTFNDVFFYKNRLGLVSDENVVFSAAGDFGRFFRGTVTALLDADPVDVAISATNVAKIQFAVPFNGSLMLFADQTQFALNIDRLLTPSSVSIDAVTNYEMNTRARPVGLGNDVYFATEAGNYSRMREYFVQEGDAQSTDAADITAHVTRYLPSGIFKMAGSSNEDVLFAISDKAGERNRVYIYKYHWSGEQKVQSSWSYWEHGTPDTEILSISVLDNELFILAKHDDGTYLEKCNVEAGAVSGALDVAVLLDQLCSVTGTYDGANEWTEFTLPIEVASADRSLVQFVYGPDFTGNIGARFGVTGTTWVDANTVRISGDHTDGEVFIGLPYNYRYQFSEQFVMKQNDVAVTTGKLQIRNFTIYYTNTAFFKTEVAPYGINPNVEEIIPGGFTDFTAKTLGEASLRVGEAVYDTGQYRFSVFGNSQRCTVAITNDTHVQCEIQGAEWEALYYNRAGAR